MRTTAHQNLETLAAINLDLNYLAQEGLIHDSWVTQLMQVQPELLFASDTLNARLASGEAIAPQAANIMRAFQIPFDQVKVLILGQDPYPTPGDAVGLAFSVDQSQAKIPRSLANIFRELVDDIGCEYPATGDLSEWTEQGVMLLNRVLTVRTGEAGSHRGIGWETVTECAVRALNARESGGLVAALWGNDARQAADLLDSAEIIDSAHPSPLSARRGFFGSRPFSRVNAALKQLGEQPIKWALPSSPHLF